MTDAVVSFVLENLKILLIHEANLFRRVEDKVNLLQVDLGFMNAFLKDSEGKQNNHHLVKELIDQIRGAAFDAEDVINTYMAQVIKQRMRNLLLKSLHCFDHAAALHRLAKKTTSVKKKIENIYANKTTYGIEAQSHEDEEAEKSLQERRRNVEEEDVVGFVDDTEKLVYQLLDPDRLQREVISIVGMGGLGKTTLARKIYNNALIKDRFNFCSWINVSQKYKTRLLLLDILKCIGGLSAETYDTMSDEELKVRLRDNLKRKRYFVVMDDVWKPEFWDEIKPCFPNNSNGSRILITSREKEVASNASSTPPYFLSFLDEEASWQLLCKKAFRGEKCPSNLESLGRKLAESCKGLPLSIVLLGGILANREKTHRAWSDFVGNVNSFLIYDDEKRCADILALSYNHLPRKLRVCFLYVGIFPEDHLISARTLTQLWVAEGFISVQNDSRNTDEIKIAEQYLEGLIDRSLIQVANWRSDGGVKTCRIHDLLRDFCIKMSIEQKFYEVLVNEPCSSNSNDRRLSIQGNICCYKRISSSSTSSNSISVGSVLFFASYVDCNSLKWALENFRFIRSLCFEISNGLDSQRPIPEEIGQLVFLRYFRIYVANAFAHLESIPASICKLPYLETIHVQALIWKALPKEIWIMKQLRHLYVGHGIGLPQPPSKGDHTLSNLQVLSSVDVHKKIAVLFRKSLFPNLRKLQLSALHRNRIDEAMLSEILASLESLQYLQTLKLSRFEFVSFGQRLDLFLPSSSSKLTKITVRESNGVDLISLGKLANLRILKINCVDMPRQLHFMVGEFPQLEVFKMISLRDITTWELEAQAMPNLQHLVVKRCTSLRNLPDELWSLANLRMVEVSDIETDLKEKLMIKQSKMKEDRYSCKLIIN